MNLRGHVPLREETADQLLWSAPCQDEPTSMPFANEQCDPAILVASRHKLSP